METPSSSPEPQASVPSLLTPRDKKPRELKNHESETKKYLPNVTVRKDDATENNLVAETPEAEFPDWVLKWKKTDRTFYKDVKENSANNFGDIVTPNDVEEHIRKTYSNNIALLIIERLQLQPAVKKSEPDDGRATVLETSKYDHATTKLPSGIILGISDVEYFETRFGKPLRAPGKPFSIDESDADRMLREHREKSNTPNGFRKGSINLQKGDISLSIGLGSNTTILINGEPIAANDLGQRDIADVIDAFMKATEEFLQVPDPGTIEQEKSRGKTKKALDALRDSDSDK